MYVTPENSLAPVAFIVSLMDFLILIFFNKTRTFTAKDNAEK